MYCPGLVAWQTEVVTDRGGEWEGEFHDLLQQALVDHRLTSPSRPQADGLCERSVSSIKQALRKLCQDTGNFADWDLNLQWVLLAGVPVQCAERHGLCALLPAVWAAAHSASCHQERMEEPIDFDDPEAAAADVLARAELIKRACVMAGANQRIAQHRDTLRYATVRGGATFPSLWNLSLGTTCTCVGRSSMARCCQRRARRSCG
jgi:hypothetical protein